ncbi:M20/M25/M40 family metallo-hydrolase (plasmid) [Pontibacillus sp. ALD_SL1]|uniref:M20/M25/M40 family metallo-hydrolase n=1 Tax=Pontibacillus sp. ALD_SL1 TaxID=2777185 RepID=UPI001A96A10B|nr:M20/M25/M40 family metallo-hydrolase [Pontibacillus sp. ALD_SL1]QST02300.1 M20/M25/M40 family metallo-hydrolase [Pontibacillus sp. ALD_SL1]
MWQTKNELIQLHKRLVEVPSVTGTHGEIAQAEMIQRELRSLPYFKTNGDHLRLHPTNDGRKFLTALVKKPGASRTVILLSHFDVVDVEDYGNFRHLAFMTEDLTKEYKTKLDNFPSAVTEDVNRGGEEWKFGRGSMDMKAGVALHMSMIEKAASGAFQGNVLMVSVPDEEVNSAGMLSAVPLLMDFKKRYGLEYCAVLNGEPMFQNIPDDPNKYIYTGSIGKVLPGFFCLGKETHVGEPYRGLNSNYMTATLTGLMELNRTFCEEVEGERTPPPVNLIQKDYKEHYSVQTPHSSVCMFNVFYMKKPIRQLTKELLEIAHEAVGNIEKKYMDEGVTQKVNVFTFEELKQEAVRLHGEGEVRRRLDYLESKRGGTGDRDFTASIVQDLSFLCKDLAPMIVLFYAPPFYPAVSSHHNKEIRRVAEEASRALESLCHSPVKVQQYFNGMSDLSFVQINETEEEMEEFIQNVPMYQRGYALPFEDIRDLQAPVLNIGPYGKDPHQRTERVEAVYSFGILPEILEESLHTLFRE